MQHSAQNNNAPKKPVPLPDWIKSLFAFIFFGVGIYYLFHEKWDAEKKVKPFNANVSHYLDREKFSDTPISIKGKVVTIDLHTRTVDPFFPTMAKRYIPNDPLEVETAIVHDCKDMVIGSYDSGAKAIQEKCDIYIVDVENKTWYRWGEISGSRPPDTIRRKTRNMTADERGTKGIGEFVLRNLQ